MPSTVRRILVKQLRLRLRNWRNPHNETRLHLARQIRRYGFEIGAFTYGAPKVRFPDTGAKLRIGRYCSIADAVEIFLGGNHRMDWISTYPFSALRDQWPGAPQGHSVHTTRGDVTIGHDVWLGAGVVVLSGVSIGHGAVIGARAVVTRDVPPYAVVAGNPANQVRLRFDEGAIAQLLASAWWDLPPRLVGEIIPLLQSARIEELARRVAELRARESSAAFS
jgi:acetyltransferase-like isoleucine patch superfamily enzyme